MFTLRLLGSPSIEHSDGPVTGPATQRRRIALLALLASHADPGISRDKLLALLWPELDAERGRRALSTAVYALRQSLGREAVLSLRSDALRLNRDVVRVDLGDFLGALKQKELERAAHLYTGPFLDGFFLSDAPEFERWVEGERDRLARTYADTLEGMAEQRESEGDYRGAVVWWRRLAAHDPYSSRFALRLLQSLIDAGDPGAALQHAHTHAARLRDELGVEPDDEVAAFVERLQAERQPASRPAERARRGPAHRPRPVRVETAHAGEQTVPSASTDAPRSGPSPPLHPSTPPQRKRLRNATVAGAVLLPLIAAGLLYGIRQQEAVPAEAPPRIRSLAVLPLENCTPDPERPGRPDAAQEYFADGLTDALITEVARIPGLRVISRTSAMRYKGECGSRERRERSLSQIARELDVDAVVEGTLVRDRERIRINAQLIRISTDEHLWAEGLEYERDLRDVLALQGEIVSAIAGAVRARALASPSAQPSANRRVDPAAYPHYLKGRYLWNEHVLASHEEALRHFEQAVAIDPGFAPAYSGLADVYVHLDEWGGEAEREANHKGMVAARRALALDDGLAEAHASLAHLLMHEERWEEAEREYQRAVELDASNANARILYAFYLSAWERHEEAILNAVRALESDPLAARAHGFAGYTLFFAKRYDEAIAQWQRLLELYPDQHETYFTIAASHLLQGRREAGLNWARRGVERANDAPWARVHLARCLALAGDPGSGAQMLNAALRDAAPDELDPLLLAQAFAVTGNTDEAFRWLERANEGNHGWLMFLRVEPAYEPLRSDPRFAAWIQRMRLDG